MMVVFDGRVKHGVFLFASLSTILMLMAALTAPAWTQCQASNSTQTYTVKFSLSGTITELSTPSTSQSGFVSYKDQDNTYGGSSNCYKTALSVYILVVVSVLLNALAVLVYIPSRNRKNADGEKIKAFDHIVQFLLFSSSIISAAAVGHFNLDLQCLTKVENSSLVVSGSTSAPYSTSLVG